MADKQVKSKHRVADHGEVFTAEREVNAMLDLVKNETERIESRFLEPACGDGNFLAEILRRKLEVVQKRYSGNRTHSDFGRVKNFSHFSFADSDMNEVSQQWRHPQGPAPGASCSCTSCCPTGYQPHGAAGHRPA